LKDASKLRVCQNFLSGSKEYKSAFLSKSEHKEQALLWMQTEPEMRGGKHPSVATTFKGQQKRQARAQGNILCPNSNTLVSLALHIQGGFVLHLGLKLVYLCLGFLQGTPILCNLAKPSWENPFGGLLTTILR